MRDADPKQTRTLRFRIFTGLVVGVVGVLGARLVQLQLLDQDRYAEAATRHAHTTLQHHFRSDGSSYHVVDYEPATGDVIGKQTWQGVSDGSARPRGAMLCCMRRWSA